MLSSHEQARTPKEMLAFLKEQDALYAAGRLSLNAIIAAYERVHLAIVLREDDSSDEQAQAAAAGHTGLEFKPVEHHIAARMTILLFEKSKQTEDVRKRFELYHKIGAQSLSGKNINLPQFVAIFLNLADIYSALSGMVLPPVAPPEPAEPKAQTPLEALLAGSDDEVDPQELQSLLITQLNQFAKEFAQDQHAQFSQLFNYGIQDARIDCRFYADLIALAYELYGREMLDAHSAEILSRTLLERVTILSSQLGIGEEKLEENARKSHQMALEVQSALLQSLATNTDDVMVRRRYIKAHLQCSRDLLKVTPIRGQSELIRQLIAMNSMMLEFLSADHEILDCSTDMIAILEFLVMCQNKSAIGTSPQKLIERKIDLATLYVEKGLFQEALSLCISLGAAETSPIPRIALILVQCFVGTQQAEKALACMKPFLNEHLPTPSIREECSMDSAEALYWCGRAIALAESAGSAECPYTARACFEQALAESQIQYAQRGCPEEQRYRILLQLRGSTMIDRFRLGNLSKMAKEKMHLQTAYQRMRYAVISRPRAESAVAALSQQYHMHVMRMARIEARMGLAEDAIAHYQICIRHLVLHDLASHLDDCYFLVYKTDVGVPETTRMIATCGLAYSSDEYHPEWVADLQKMLKGSDDGDTELQSMVKIALCKQYLLSPSDEEKREPLSRVTNAVQLARVAWRDLQQSKFTTLAFNALLLLADARARKAELVGEEQVQACRDKARATYKDAFSLAREDLPDCRKLLQVYVHYGRVDITSDGLDVETAGFVVAPRQQLAATAKSLLQKAENIPENNPERIAVLRELAQSAIAVGMVLVSTQYYFECIEAMQQALASPDQLDQFPQQLRSPEAIFNFCYSFLLLLKKMGPDYNQEKISTALFTTIFMPIDFNHQYFPGEISEHYARIEYLQCCWEYASDPTGRLPERERMNSLVNFTRGWRMRLRDHPEELDVVKHDLLKALTEVVMYQLRTDKAQDFTQNLNQMLGLMGMDNPGCIVLFSSRTLDGGIAADQAALNTFLQAINQEQPIWSTNDLAKLLYDIIVTPDAERDGSARAVLAKRLLNCPDLTGHLNLYQRAVCRGYAGRRKVPVTTEQDRYERACLDILQNPRSKPEKCQTMYLEAVLAARESGYIDHVELLYEEAKQAGVDMQQSAWQYLQAEKLYKQLGSNTAKDNLRAADLFKRVIQAFEQEDPIFAEEDFLIVTKPKLCFMHAECLYAAVEKIKAGSSADFKDDKETPLSTQMHSAFSEAYQVLSQMQVMPIDMREEIQSEYRVMRYRALFLSIDPSTFKSERLTLTQVKQFFANLLDIERRFVTASNQDDSTEMARLVASRIDHLKLLGTYSSKFYWEASEERSRLEQFQVDLDPRDAAKSHLDCAYALYKQYSEAASVDKKQALKGELRLELDRVKDDGLRSSDLWRSMNLIAMERR